MKILVQCLKRTLCHISAMAPTLQAKFVFIDMEMTGLDVKREEIMEVACVVTTPELEPVHRGFQTIIHVDDSKLLAMDEWCTRQHGKTGLTEECRNSKVTLAEAENQLHSYIQQHSKPKDILYMSGNTIYMDRMFLQKYMPAVDKLLHYRLVDVSTVKTLCRHWYPHDKSIQPRKKLNHRALDDVYDSIEELKYYRSNVFK